MKWVLFILVTAPLAWSSDACIGVAGLRVTAADIAGSVPAFKALPPETMLGYAPTPGLTRWWRGAELARLAARNGLAAGGLPDFCVQRPTKVLSTEEVTTALQAVLPEGAKLTLLEFCRVPMPEGKLTFLLRSLQRSTSPSPAAPLLWRGQVVYDGSRSAPFWASVRVSSSRTGQYAVKEIARGRVLEAGDVHEETREASLFEPEPVRAVEEVVGHEARYLIRAGLPITAQALTSPREVLSGEIVRVQVASGAARLSFDARAANAGRLGEMVFVENVENGKRFRARVDGRKQVSVHVEDQDVQSNEVLDRRPGARAAGGERVARRSQVQEAAGAERAGPLH